MEEFHIPSKHKKGQTAVPASLKCKQLLLFSLQSIELLPLDLYKRKNNPSLCHVRISSILALPLQTNSGKSIFHREALTPRVIGEAHLWLGEVMGEAHFWLGEVYR